MPPGLLPNLTATSLGGYTNPDQGAVNNAVNLLGPGASTWETPASAPQQTLKGGGTAGSPSNIDQFFGKIGNVWNESIHMFEGAAKWVGRQGATAVNDIINLPSSSVHLGMDWYNTEHYQALSNAQDSTILNLIKEYHSGIISGSQYSTQYKEWQTVQNQLTNRYSNLSAKIGSDGGKFYQDSMGTLAAVVTVMSAGVASPLSALADQGTKDAATYLASDAAKEFIAPAENTIVKLAANKALMDALPSSIQNAVRSSVTDTFMNVGTNVTTGSIARATATNMLFNYPMTFNWLTGSSSSVFKELQAGKYGSAINTTAFNLAMAFSGGPIGQAFKYGGEALHGLASRTFGSTSFLDTLSKAVGNGDVQGLYTVIKDNPDATKAFQALESTNLAAENGRVGSAVYRIVNGLKMNNVMPSEMTHQEFVNNMMGWHVAQTDTTKTMTDLLGASQARKFVVGRTNPADNADIAKTVTNGATTQERLQNWDNWKTSHPTTAAANNENLDKQVKSLINSTSDTQELHGKITSIKARMPANGVPQDLIDRNAKRGYEVIAPSKLEAPFVQGNQKISTEFASRSISNSEAGIPNSQFFTKAVQPLPILKEVGATLTYLGLSPERAQTSVYDTFKENLANNLSNSDTLNSINAKLRDVFNSKNVVKTVAKNEVANPSGLSKDELAFLKKQGYTPETNPEVFQPGKLSSGEFKVAPESPTPATDVNKIKYTPQNADYIVKQLSSHINKINQDAAKFNLHALPISDMRQLTNKEIVAALGVTTKQADEVSSAINHSMIEIKLAERGLGTKFLDYVQAVGSGNKLSMGSYLRLQGALRFAWNPFFKLKLISKTEILTQLESGGKWPPSSHVDQGLASIFGGRYGNLQDTANMLEQKGMFSGGFTNEATTDSGAITKTMAPTQLLNSQKKSIAGLISSQAERQGMSVQDFVNNFPNQTRDTVESILHYNPNSSFLNSPLARTLNFAFFPFRFNVKVGTFMARSLARQPAMVQVGIIHGLLQAHTYLTSEQGQQWYSQNSDVLGLLTYFSPLETLSTILSLGHIGHESVGSLGELGGLPMGFIPQILNAEGLTQSAPAYVNPKTGQPGTNYIPKTDMAKLATAISSFLGSLFTYPGSEAGLPSKSGSLAKITEGITGSKSTDWTKVPQTNLTPQQQQFSQSVQALQNVTGRQPAGTQVVNPEPTQVPETANTTAQPYYRKTGSSTPPPTKLKKSQEPLTLLPGQTHLGQIL